VPFLHGPIPTEPSLLRPRYRLTHRRNWNTLFIHQRARARHMGNIL